MIDIQWIAERLWASITAVMFGTFLVSIAPSAEAVVFNKCTPESSAWMFIGDPEKQEHARQRETERCNAQNSVLDTWSAKIRSLEAVREKLQAASNTGQWEEFLQAINEVRPLLIEIQKAAVENPDVRGSGNLRSLFAQDLNYFFQNAGLPAPASFEAALDRISEASKNTAQRSIAATLANSILNQSINRGTEFVIGLGQSASEKVRAETSAMHQAAGESRRDHLEGRTASGYFFGGFTDRILSVWKPWLTMLLVVTFIGAWLGIKRRLNPVTAATAAGLAYLVPGTAMAGSFVFLPFLPKWFMIAATLAGTAATYFYSGPIFGWLAARVGTNSPTGRRLLTLGGTLENLRVGLGGSRTAGPGEDVVGKMAAAQATHGSSRWGTSDEMREGGHLAAPGSADGFALARVPDVSTGFDPRFRFTGHVVTVAPTGSGKGIGAVIPNLLDYAGSALVLDVKGENAAVTSRARREMGHKVFVVDPFGVNKGEAHAFNLLDRLNPTDPECVSESAILADCLVIPDEKGGGKHFDESAKTLLQGLMLHVVGLDDPTRSNLGEVRRLLTSDEETLLVTLADMAADESAAFGIPARAANTLMGMADRERGSVLSTARRNTAFLDDPRVAATLSRSDFNLANIKAELMTVYLVLPANKIGPNARFVRAFIGSVIAVITSSATQPKHRVAFLLDEFGQLGYMKQIEDAVSLLRGYGLAFWVFIQDLSQLKGVYPKWQTFLANSAKTFYGTDDYDTAKYVSDSLGQGTIEYETHNEGKNRGQGMSGGGASLNQGKSAGSSQQVTGRHLLTPDEVMRLGPERPIVLVKGEYPYQLARLNYLVDAEYVGKADPNPYHS
jgi:type IV secretory pathway TraG/TraD family ATPase VirD4